MKSSLSFPSDDDSDAAEKGKNPDATSPDDALHAAQQKHRREERKAVLTDIADHFRKPKPDAANLDRIRGRWETGIVDQLHIGKWASIWPILDAAHSLPGFCSTGLVIFGGWFAPPPPDLSGIVPPPDDPLRLVIDYGIYAATLDLIAGLLARIKVSPPVSADECKRCVAELKEWMEGHRKQFGLLASQPDDFKEIKNAATSYVEDFPPIIKNTLMNLENRVFLFYPDEHDPASGWADFFTFADAYSRLPGAIINGFGDYFLIIQTPGVIP